MFFRRTILNLTVCVGTALSFCAGIRADEGMWLPLLLQQNQDDMRRLGLQITAEDIYSINRSSLKDAIVQFGGGCTGEVVSGQGLVLTNHHCGFGYIQYHSSVEHDYLTKGFWAQTLQDELPCPGLEVRFLREMRDVTDIMLEGITARMPEAERQDSIRARAQRLQRSLAEENTDIKVLPFYYGNQYYLFVYDVFKDVRLVGAPPSNIGKFGGDTDNWMWPRHTGDFSVFRIYADKDNRAAAYSPDNQPYKPKEHLKIDLRGYDEGDFTFVFGYPGRTQEYLSSYGVEQVLNLEDPMRVAARTARLEVIKAAMERDPAVRIQYAAKAASIANGWKKWMGEMKGINRINVLGSKRDYEKVFQDWAEAPVNAEYAGVLPALKEAYKDMELYLTLAVIFQEHIFAPEAVSFAYSFNRLCRVSKGEDRSVSLEQALEECRAKAQKFFKDYNEEVDRQLFVTMLTLTRQENGLNAQLLDLVGSDLDRLVNEFYGKSLFPSSKRLTAFLDKYKASDYKKIEKDPLYSYAGVMFGIYQKMVSPMLAQGRKRIDSLQRVYMKGQLAMKESGAFAKLMFVGNKAQEPVHNVGSSRFYPDANFTLRVTYGKVKGFSPADAVRYRHYTTLDGIMQKENPDIYDYVVEARLKDLYARKDYGRYANALGEMPVAFIGTNHTTGGNSGSPVLNGDGYLMGINFDRNWEGTMSDIRYDPEMCRNIMLDIRYCLFIIDKFAGATRLIDEMDIVE
ncbi:MAG: S46 family peptidase [Bacteroides sp.]|nr:S46 family peptidase [Bacteroides sp.]MCM1085549.1 S46 family peptidase [Bacteroides sp.]MCM1170367.1 S46 family peptidase [Bacteroides sp.]